MIDFQAWVKFTEGQGDDERFTVASLKVLAPSVYDSALHHLAEALNASASIRDLRELSRDLHIIAENFAIEAKRNPANSKNWLELANEMVTLYFLVAGLVKRQTVMKNR